MSITVVCPNGHTLSVKDTCAGKRGLCPVCKAAVIVPAAVADGMSDDDIMGILGPHDPGRHRPFVPDESEAPRSHGAASAKAGESGNSSPPKKSCEKCNAEILAATRICPHCHTYIADLSRL
jgi:hypothetical protein